MGFFASKWRAGCRLPKYSKNHEVLYHVTQKDVFRGYFQRLRAVLVFCQPEIVVQTTRRHFITFYETKYSTILGVFCYRCPGFLRPLRHFESREGPGEKIWPSAQTDQQTPPWSNVRSVFRFI